MGVNYFIAGIWGFLEAIIFFIVPDVWLSKIALKDLRATLIAALITAICALFGGILMYLWSAHNYDQVYRVVSHLPAINAKMITAAEQDVAAQGMVAMFFGPLSGIPYKIYAMIAGNQSLSLMLFLVISIPARLMRFIVVILLTRVVSKTLMKKLNDRQKLYTHLAFWLGFYALWFVVMSGW